MSAAVFLFNTRGQDTGRLHLLVPTQAGTSAIPPGTQHCY